MKQTEGKSTLLLRIAIAFAFLYPPFDALSNPNAWIGFFPPFVLGYVSNGTLLLLWGAVMVILALWILWGKKLFIPSAAATVVLLAIVAFNLPLLEIVFRDLSLALVAATMAWWSYQAEMR